MAKKNQTESISSQEHQQKADEKAIKISIKTIIIIVAIIALAALVYLCKGLLIAATVDGSPISRLSVVQKLEETGGKSILDSFVIEKLIQNKAKLENITVSNDEVSAEMKKIEDQIVAQGSTLDSALSTEGITLDDLKRQVIIQIEVEKIVADKINVTDEEVTQYIKDNAVTIPEGQEASTTAQIKDTIKSQKLNTEANALIDSLRSQANIRYFVNY